MCKSLSYLSGWQEKRSKEESMFVCLDYLHSVYIEGLDGAKRQVQSAVHVDRVDINLFCKSADRVEKFCRYESVRTVRCEKVRTSRGP